MTTLLDKNALGPIHALANGRGGEHPGGGRRYPGILLGRPRTDSVRRMTRALSVQDGAPPPVARRSGRPWSAPSRGWRSRRGRRRVDSRSIEFLDVMIAMAVIGVLSFVAGLIVIYARQAPGLRSQTNVPQWYGFLPALLLVVAAAGVLVWLIARGGQWAWGESIPNW